MKQKHDFADRKFYSLLFSSSVGMAITYIMLLSDTIIAGWSLGESAIAAVNIVTPVFAISAFFSTMISSGTSFSFSYEMGKYDKKRASEFFGQGIILAFIIGIGMFLLTLFGESTYFSLLGPSADILNYAHSYYIVYPFITLLYPLYTVLYDAVYSDGDDMICNIANFVQIVGNIVCSIVLVQIIGIMGISIGTLVGVLLATISLLFHFRKEANSLKYAKHISIADMLHVFRYGITDGEQYLCNGVMLYLFNGYFISGFGSASLPVITVATGLVEITIIFDGIGQAVSPLINTFLGEKNNLGIRKIMRTSKITAITEGIIFSILLIIFAKYVPLLIGITDQNIIAQSIPAIRIISITMVFSALSYLYTSYYLLLDKTFLPVFMTFINNLFCPVAIGFLLAKLIGINGLWIGIATAPVLSILAGMLIVLIQNGKSQVPLLLNPIDDAGITSFDTVLGSQEIVVLRDSVENLLNEHNIPSNIIFKIMLLIEELCTLIESKNPEKKIYCELTIIISDNTIRIILRDSGEIFNITDTDMNLSSLNAFVVSSLMESSTNKRNLTTMGYNRNEFSININA